MEENTLQFDNNNLFNNEILHQYDEDAQKGFLSYLLRNKNWQITENKIVFPEIKTEEKVQELLKNYDTSIMKEHLDIKKQTLSTVFIFGFEETKKILNKETKEIEKRENKSKKLER